MPDMAVTVECSGPNKGRVTERPLTQDEIDQRAADAAAHAAEQAAREAALAEQQALLASAEAKLQNAGLTPEEAKAVIEAPASARTSNNAQGQGA